MTSTERTPSPSSQAAIARASLVVRHEPNERRPVKTHERRRWGDLQEPRVAENRRRYEHLRGVEVPDIGERGSVFRGAPGVRERLFVPIGGEGIERDELDRPVVLRTRELDAEEHLTARSGRRPAERQAHIDAIQSAAKTTRLLEWLRGAGARGSTRARGAACAGTACPCASSRGSVRRLHRTRRPRSAPR
jgi:hypothetical protein